jgi:glyoxylase-like metal-dependent hydrolase (beta-lactamase superfamily II)
MRTTSIDRRSGAQHVVNAITAALCFWLATVVGLFAPVTANATPPLRLTDGVYAVTATPGPPDLINRGRTHNSGLLIGAQGVVVIDPGPSRRDGQRLLRTLRTLTRKPVVAVILTHAHPENVLAAAVVAGARAPVIASHRTYALMQERCSECLQRLTGMTGESAMTGTTIRLPDQTVAEGITERRYGGRAVQLIHTGWGHTAGDLAVLDVESGTLFTGGLANNGVMPDMHEARTRGWITALQRLEALEPRRVVPGEGLPGGPGLLAATRSYLTALLERVEASYRQQGSVFDVLADGELPEYTGWTRYREAQPLNIQHVYAELEKEDFAAR